MEQKKKDALLELLGNDEALVEKVLSATKEINEKADSPDAVFKEATVTSPEGEKVEQLEEEEEVIEKEQVEQVKESSDTDVLIMLKSMREQMETLSSQVQSLQESSNAPRITLHRPSVSSEVADDTEIASETKSDEGYPRAVQGISNMVLRQGR